MLDKPFAEILRGYEMPTLEDKLEHLIYASKIRRSRYTEVKPTLEEAIAELERLREIEFIYQGLSK